MPVGWPALQPRPPPPAPGPCRVDAWPGCVSWVGSLITCLAALCWVLTASPASGTNAALSQPVPRLSPGLSSAPWPPVDGRHAPAPHASGAHLRRAEPAAPWGLLAVDSDGEGAGAGPETRASAEGSAGRAEAVAALITATAHRVEVAPDGVQAVQSLAALAQADGLGAIPPDDPHCLSAVAHLCAALSPAVRPPPPVRPLPLPLLTSLTDALFAVARRSPGLEEYFRAVGQPLREALRDAVAAASLAEDGPQSTGTQLCHLLWTSARLALLTPGAADPLCRQLLQPPVFNNVTLVDATKAVGALARIRHPHPHLLGAVADLARGLGSAGAEAGRLTGRGVANLMWAYATLGVSHIPLLAHLADFTLQHGAQLTFKAQELSNVAWACATLGYRREPLMAAVATWLVSPAMVPTLRAQNIANTLWAYAALNISNAALFDTLADVIAGQIDALQFSPQEVAMAAWAYAALGQCPSPALRAIVAYSTLPAFVERMDGHAMATLSWAMAKCNVTDAPLLHCLASAVVAPDGPRFETVQAAANLMWAFATLGVRDEAVFARLADRLLGHTAAWNTQDVANVAWAFAKANVRNGTVLATAARLLLRRQAHLLQTISAQDLATVAWAFATLGAGFQHRPLFAALAHRFLAGGFFPAPTTEGLVTIAWAFAKAQVTHDLLMTHVGDLLLRDRRLAEAGAEDGADGRLSARLVWAFAAQRVPHAVVLAVGARMVDQAVLETLTPTEVEHLAWAFADLRIRDRRVLRRLLAHTLQPARLTEFPPVALAGVTAAVTELRAASPPVLAALRRRVFEEDFLADLAPADAARLCHAFTVGGAADDPLLLTLLLRAQPLLHATDRVSLRRLAQLHAVHLHALLQPAHYPATCALLRNSTRFLRVCSRQFRLKSRSRHTLFQQQVATLLSWQGIHTDPAVVLTDAGGYGVDLQLRGTRVVMLLPTDRKLLRSGPQHLLPGSLLLRHQHLRLSGYRPVYLPHYAWRRLGTDRARANLLRRLLAAAAADGPPDPPLPPPSPTPLSPTTSERT